jgi:hypothetical protein
VERRGYSVDRQDSGRLSPQPRVIRPPPPRQGAGVSDELVDKDDQTSRRRSSRPLHGLDGYQSLDEDDLHDRYSLSYSYIHTLCVCRSLLFVCVNVRICLECLKNEIITVQ